MLPWRLRSGLPEMGSTVYNAARGLEKQDAVDPVSAAFGRTVTNDKTPDSRVGVGKMDMQAIVARPIQSGSIGGADAFAILVSRVCAERQSIGTDGPRSHEGWPIPNAINPLRHPELGEIMGFKCITGRKIDHESALAHVHDLWCSRNRIAGSIQRLIDRSFLEGHLPLVRPVTLQIKFPEIAFEIARISDIRRAIAIDVLPAGH